MINIINIHTIICVHNILLVRTSCLELRIEKINSTYTMGVDATSTVMTTIHPNVSMPLLKHVNSIKGSTKRPNITLKSNDNQTRDFSYVGHQLIRPWPPKTTTTPKSAASTRTASTGHKTVAKQRIPSINVREDKEADGEILRKFTSEQCFIASGRNKNASSTVREVRILGLFALSNSSLKQAGASEALAANLAIKHVNQMRILGCNYRLTLVTNDTKGDPSVAVTDFFHAMFTDKNRTIKAVLASSNIEVTGAMARITFAWQLPTVSFGESSPELSDAVKYPMFFRLVAPDTSHNYARIAFLHFFNWTWVMTVCQQKEQHFWSINDLLNKLESSNINQEKSISFTEQDVDNFLRTVNERDTKIIVASFSQNIASKIFCKVYEMGLFGGDYIWILPANLRTEWWNTTYTPCPKKHLMESIEGVIFIGSKRHLEDDERAVSFMGDKEFHKELPNLKSTHVRETYDAVWSIALALRRTLAICTLWHTEHCHQSLLHKVLQKNLTSNFQYVRFKGISGPVLFQGADRICITNFYQIQGGIVHRIAEYDPLTKRLDLNCKRCKKIRWPSGYIPISRRTYELLTVYILPEAFTVITILSFCGIVISLCFLILNIVYREEKYIKLSSPNLNATTIIGCVLVYLAVIFLGLDSSLRPDWIKFSIICAARVTLISIGCSLAFGSIFAKTYRVHQIFIKSNHGILKSKVLQDSRLVPILGVFVLIDGIIITSWTFLDPLDRHLYNLTLESGFRPTEIIRQLQVEVCDCEHKNWWIFSLSIYKAIFVILGLYIAWETRYVKIPSLNDSEHIGLTVYGVSITAVLHFTLANVMSDKITLAYLTSSCLILFTTTSSMCLLFLPKIIAIFRNEENLDNQIVGVNSDLKIESNTIRFVKNDDQEPYYRVHIQNFAYRKYIAFLDKEIQNLQYKLYFRRGNRPTTSQLRKPPPTIKVYDKISTLRRFGREKSSSLCNGMRREKSSSLCGGMPNLFMLTVLPVVIPRASWPYAEQQVRPPGNEFNFNSESKLQTLKYHSSSAPLPDIPYIEEDDPADDRSYYRTRWRGRFYSDLSAIIPEDVVVEDESPTLPDKALCLAEYPENTSSEDSDNDSQTNANVVLKICKAIVVQNDEERVERVQCSTIEINVNSETQEEDFVADAGINI